jgi:hypothetical protein
MDKTEIKMNYKKIYDNLIFKRLKTPLSSNVYGEYHHIVPKCMGGSDEKSNIVKLSAKEHYFAHRLLWKIYKTPPLAHAWFCMTRNSDGQYRQISSKQYDSAKKAHSEVLKESMLGEGNHFYGKTHSNETKAKISKANKGRKKSKEEIDNWVKKVAKKPKSTEHKKKIGRKGMLMLKNINTNECIRILKSELKNYDPTLWINPVKAAGGGAKTKCKYCGFENLVGLINRWHNENCKFKDTGKYISKEEMYLKQRSTSKKQIPVEIDGKRYKSINNAAKELGVSKYDIRKIVGL